MQSNTKQLILGGAVGLLLLSAVLYYTFEDLGISWGREESVATTTPEGASLEDLIKEGKAEIITEDGASVPVPSLDRPVTFPADFPEEGKPIARDKIAALSAKLKANPLSYGDWIDLGMYRKITADFTGAKEAWSYAAAISPDAALAYHNLGVLSFENLKDPTGAENYLKRALRNDPAALHTYQEFHRLYRYWLKTDTTLAADILKEGIVKNPGAIDLMMLLGAYYKEEGNKAGAKAAYEEALAAAKARQNSSLVGTIEAEIASLN